MKCFRGFVIFCILSLNIVYASCEYSYPKPCQEIRIAISSLGDIRDVKSSDIATKYSSLWGNGEEIETDNVAHFFYSAATNIAFDDWTCSNDGKTIAFVENMQSGCNSVRFYVYKKERNTYKKIGAYNFCSRLLSVQENKTELTSEGLLVTAAYSSGEGKVRDLHITLFFSFSTPESSFNFLSDRQKFHDFE